MKKVLKILIPLFIVILVVGGMYFFIIKDAGKGALQVTANPKSAVYINGKLAGQTPLCKCDPSDMLASGEYAIRIVPLNSDTLLKEAEILPFEQKIKINKSVLTVVDRTFEKGAASEGSIITLSSISNSKMTQLLLMSFPQKSETFLDSSSVGSTPVVVKNISVSDHEVLFKKEGYKDKTLHIRTALGYKLEALAFLGVSGDAVGSPQSATHSAALPSVTPTIAPLYVVIQQTPTGYLNVRSSNSVESSKITVVYPGDIFELVSESNGWYQIKLSNGKTGWISADYATKK